MHTGKVLSIRIILVSIVYQKSKVGICVLGSIYLVWLKAKPFQAKIMASLKHYFNTYNCVSTPVNPSSRLPMPSYERLSSEVIMWFTMKDLIIWDKIVVD